MVPNTRTGAMAALLLLCTASLTAGRQLRGASTRIFNGVDAAELVSIDPAFDLSFLVAFYRTSTIEAQGGEATPFCTGTLINSNMVLTAAHCFFADGEFTPNNVDASVRIEGEKDRLIPVSVVSVHPGYVYQSPDADANDKTAPYDVAVVKLAEATTVTPVGAVAGDAYMPPVGETLLIAGYGDTNQTELEDDTGTTNTLTAAVVSYLGETCPQVGQPGTVCAGGVANTCQGDSGGPLLAGDETTNTLFVLGITSYGAYCGQLTAGGLPEFGFYTDVRVHYDAINVMITELSALA